MTTRIVIVLLFGWLACLPMIAATVVPAHTYNNGMPAIVDDTVTTNGNAVAVVSGGNVQFVASQTVRLEPGFSVTGGGVFTAKTTTLPDIIGNPIMLTATVGTPFSYTFRAINGPILSYRLLYQGTLPSGISFDTTTGTLAGTPGQTWQGSILVYATNSVGEGESGLADFVVSAGASPPAATITASASGYATVTGSTNAVSSPTLAITSGTAFTISLICSDSANGLTSEQFDFSTDGGSTWSLGNSGNARLWTGGPTGSNILAKTFSLSVGTYLFRGYGTNQQGLTSAYQYVTVAVTAAPPPSITTQPQSQTANVGYNVTFTVAASGTGTLSYQWRKNGANIYGATGSNLLLTNVQLSDAASYDVVVTDSNGTSTSNAATLTVNASASSPVITSATTASGTINTPFSYLITATNNPTSYSASGLPSGLSVNTSSGEVAGTPTQSGTFSITITAANAAGSGSATLTLSIGGSSQSDTNNQNQLNIHIPF